MSLNIIILICISFWPLKKERSSKSLPELFLILMKLLEYDLLACQLQIVLTYKLLHTLFSFRHNICFVTSYVQVFYMYLFLIQEPELLSGIALCCTGGMIGGSNLGRG
jgi:hypothetical protein